MGHFSHINVFRIFRIFATYSGLPWTKFTPYTFHRFVFIANILDDDFDAASTVVAADGDDTVDVDIDGGIVVVVFSCLQWWRRVLRWRLLVKLMDDG